MPLGSFLRIDKWYGKNAFSSCKKENSPRGSSFKGIKWLIKLKYFSRKKEIFVHVLNPNESTHSHFLYKVNTKQQKRRVRNRVFLVSNHIFIIYLNGAYQKEREDAEKSKEWGHGLSKSKRDQVSGFVCRRDSSAATLIYSRTQPLELDYL